MKWQKLFVKFAQIFAGNAMKNAVNIKPIIARNVQEFVGYVLKNVKRWRYDLIIKDLSAYHVLAMEPYSHIVHSRRKHIDFYVKIYVTMAYVVQKHTCYCLKPSTPAS